jgi:hypothetical protein
MSPSSARRVNLGHVACVRIDGRLVGLAGILGQRSWGLSEQSDGVGDGVILPAGNIDVIDQT